MNRPSSEVLRPGQLWGAFDRKSGGRPGEYEMRSAILIVGLAEDYDPAATDFFSSFRVRALESIVASDRLVEIIWSPPGDESGLESMGYRRLV